MSKLQGGHVPIAGDANDGEGGRECGGRYGKEFPTLTAVGTSVDALVVAAAADSRLL